MKIKFSFVLIFVFVHLISTAQTLDSTAFSTTSITVKKHYPTIRPLIVQYEFFTPMDFKSKVRGYNSIKGTMKAESRFKAFGTFPLFVSKKLIFTGAINYTHHTFAINLDEGPSLDNSRVNIDDMGISINTIYLDSLWNKPLILNGSLVFKNQNFKSLDRFRYIISATYVLKRTSTTALSVGLVGLIDPLAKVPVIPILAYRRNLPGGHWVFDGILPYRIYLRRDVLDKGWLSLGGELQGVSFFGTEFNFPESRKFESNNSDIWVGGIFEYPISPYLMAGCKAGVRAGIEAEMRDMDNPSKAPLVESDRKPSLYFNFSLSLTMPKKKAEKQ